MNPERPRSLSFDHRVLALAIGAGFPASVVALWLLWTGEHTARLQWTLPMVVVGTWLGFALALRRQIVRPFQTLSNLLSALREGDFSIRAREARMGEVLGLAMGELNQLGEILRQQRRGAVEATALLGKVMAEIDVAVFAIDESGHVQLVNRGGERLLGIAAQQVIGREASDLGLADCVGGAASRIVELSLPGGSGHWELRRGTFRQGGRPHQLVVLSDLTRTLREQERQAWQRLVQVLRHEINNSLAPIKSIAESLRLQMRREPLPTDWRDDLSNGLQVIADRSGGLARFMSSYARLTQLPAPRLLPVDVRTWVDRTVALENRLPVTIEGGPDLQLGADGDQLDQLLINLLANAVEAALDTGGGVRVRWSRVNGRGEQFELLVEDDGQGLPETQHLFVPFFTTKPHGSGIGLVLSRQIAENHGGSLTLENRVAAPGCWARLRLPLKSQSESS